MTDYSTIITLDSSEAEALRLVLAFMERHAGSELRAECLMLEDRLAEADDADD